MSPPKKRLASNKKLPERWRLRRGVYWYRVPDADRAAWDGKGEFLLGRTLTEAHRVFAERIATLEQPHSPDRDFPTMATVIDQYMLTVTPKKAPATQKPERQMLGKLRAIWGDMAPEDISPVLINKAKHATAAKISPQTANHHLRILSAVFTMAIEWGAIASHPMTGKKVTKLKVERKGHYIPTDAEIDAALVYASPMLEAYVQIKIRTGLRQTDMLKLKRSDIRDDGLHITPNKTSGTTGQALIFELSPDLLHWLRAATTANRHRVQSVWIFQTRDGAPYINDQDDASGFHSAWQRWMRKVKAAGLEKFAERYLRNKVGDDSASDEEARARLGHESVTTTRAFYRSRPTKVTPIKRG